MTYASVNYIVTILPPSLPSLPFFPLPFPICRPVLCCYAPCCTMLCCAVCCAAQCVEDTYQTSLPPPSLPTLSLFAPSLVPPSRSYLPSPSSSHSSSSSLSVDNFFKAMFHIVPILHILLLLLLLHYLIIRCVFQKFQQHRSQEGNNPEC